MDHSLRRWYDIQTDNVPDEDDLESDQHEPSDEIKQTLTRNPSANVLFISDPQGGDRFEFGPIDRLQKLLQQANSQGLNADIRQAREFLGELDFNTYTNSPSINKPQTPSESRIRMRAPSLTALELMAVADRSLFEHHMSQIGLPVIGRRNNDPTEKEVQSESISSIASAITEDVNDSIQLNDYQKTAKKIAEDHGYIIKIS